jgi:hypothetical protein
MRYVGSTGVEWARWSSWRAKTNLAGMERWGYVVVAPDPLTVDRNRQPPTGSCARLLRTAGAGGLATTFRRDRGALAHAFWRGRG